MEKVKLLFALVWVGILMMIQVQGSNEDKIKDLYVKILDNCDESLQNDPMLQLKVTEKIIPDEEEKANVTESKSQNLNDELDTKIEGINKLDEEGEIMSTPNDPTLQMKLTEKNTKKQAMHFSKDKNRWFSCWVLKSALINQQSFRNHISKIILSYLVFSPIASKLDPNINEITEAALSRNGQWLLYMQHYDTHENIYLSNLASGTKIHTFTADDHLTSYAISDNNLFVIGAGVKKKIYLWNTNSGKLMTILMGHRRDVNSLCFFLDDTRILSGSSDDTMRVWAEEQSQWKCLLVIFGHTHSIMKCTVTTDNTRICSASFDGTIRVWNSGSGECERVLTGTTDVKFWASTCMCIISKDNQFVSSPGRGPRPARLWNINTGKCVKTIQEITATENVYELISIGYLSSQRLVYWTRDSKVTVWNLQTDEIIYVLPVKAAFVSVSLGGKYLIIVNTSAAAAKESLIKVYSFETGVLIK